ETRHLAERAFYFSKRLPTLMDWQVDAAVGSVLAKPELQQVLKDVTSTRESVDRVTRSIEQVPEHVASERKEILAAWDARQKETTGTVREVRDALAQGKEFAAEVR